jgi:Na+/H+ antiporter NhaD/arsenite permease-like protein
MIPWLFPDIWRTKFEHLEDLPHPQINHPKVLALGGLIIAFVLVFFIIGESFPIPLSPAAVALMGATLALLLAHESRIDSVPNILKDVDWSTLLFFMSIFVIIGSLEKTGVINSLSGILAVILGKNIPLSCIALIFFVGLLSSSSRDDSPT